MKPMITALAAALVMSPASAQPAPARLDAAMSKAVIDGCVAHAAGKSQSHGIAVFDNGGNIVASLRMDGNPPGVMAFAIDKARAVANWGFPTSVMATAVASTPGFANAPHVVTVPGGVPVFGADGTVFIGSVGVSGEAPADDAACAEAGIAAAGLASRRKAR